MLACTARGACSAGEPRKEGLRPRMAAMVKNALLLAAMMVGALICWGMIAPPTGEKCTASSRGYSGAALLQDLRAAASFCLGALLCSLATRPRAAGAAGKKNG